jgi:hypothetical protein
VSLSDAAICACRVELLLRDFISILRGSSSLGTLERNNRLYVVATHARLQSPTELLARSIDAVG